MADNLGKQFETIIRKSFEMDNCTCIIRLHDQMNGFSGSKNPCDFIVYHYPYLYAVECKTVHGNRLPLTNITDFQYSEMVKMSNKAGVFAGIICWWVDRDVTRYIPIRVISEYKTCGIKSISYDDNNENISDDISGRKRVKFFEYDMGKFFNAVRTVG